ncbi:MAG: hypothetical protein QY326_08180 [Bdellovibrionota bacterium]|nr:MAG: hypothetical protein QY326_08180 [Bdellovibrionota bacterium]
MTREDSTEAPAQENVQQALRDIAIIRRCIEQAQGSVPFSSSEQGRRVTTLLHLGLLCLSGLLLLMEVLSDGVNTKLLMISRTDAELRYVGLMNLALFLIVLSYVFYFVVARAARDRRAGPDQFIARHFSYLTNLSLFTDLFLKFVMFSLLVYAGKPEWIASLLLLFIGDYLVQGRLFVFPFRVGLLLGVLVSAGAAMCFVYGVSNLAVPLAAFMAVTLLSWMYFVRRDHLEGNK